MKKKKKKKKFRGDMLLFFSLAIEIAIVLWVFEKKNTIIRSGYSMSAGGNQIFFLLCCIVPIFLVAFIVSVLFFRKKKHLVRLGTLIVLFFIGFMFFYLISLGITKRQRAQEHPLGTGNILIIRQGRAMLKKKVNVFSLGTGIWTSQDYEQALPKIYGTKFSPSEGGYLADLYDALPVHAWSVKSAGEEILQTDYEEQVSSYFLKQNFEQIFTHGEKLKEVTSNSIYIQELHSLNRNTMPVVVLPQGADIDAVTQDIYQFLTLPTVGAQLDVDNKIRKNIREHVKAILIVESEADETRHIEFSFGRGVGKKKKKWVKEISEKLRSALANE